MNLLDSLISRVHFARKYSLSLIDATPESEWYRQPIPGLSHIAWQVGHLAMAEYGLCLAAVRGPRPSDADLLPADHKEFFGRGSKVSADETTAVAASNWPSPTELRARLDRVHQAVLDELPAATEIDLGAPALIELAVAKTKLAALQFFPEHELLHAGQIGLLRRMLGHASLR